MVQVRAAPGQSKEFKQAVTTELVPNDSFRQLFDMIAFFVEKTNVAGYLTELRNLVIGISSMSKEEKLGRFCAGKKPQAHLEGLKAGSECRAGRLNYF